MQQEEFDDIVTRITESFIHNYGYANHNVESYEHFLHFMIPEIIQEHFPIQVYSPDKNILNVIELDQLLYQRPTYAQLDSFLKELTIKKAHKLKLTYAFDILLHVTHKIYIGKEPEFELKHIRKFQYLPLCKIPCMTGSSICSSFGNLEHVSRDLGTFIINGYQKVIIAQEHMRPNFPFVSLIKGKNAVCCEIRCFHNGKIRSTSQLFFYVSAEKTGCIPQVEILINFTKVPLPLIAFLRISGLQSISEMIDVLCGSNSSTNLRYLVESILTHDTYNIDKLKTEEDVLEWMADYIQAKKNEKNIPSFESEQSAASDFLFPSSSSSSSSFVTSSSSSSSSSTSSLTKVDEIRRKKIKTMNNSLHCEFLPQCEEENTNEKDLRKTKLHLFAYSIRKTLRVYLKELPPDDIDHYSNKRITTAGTLFALMFRQLVRSFTNTLHVQVFKRTQEETTVDLLAMFQKETITKSLKYACATGNWVIKKQSKKNQTGVCQILNDANIISKISQQRLVNFPLNREGKIPKPRQLHLSRMRLLCAMETPEGKAVGLIHQLNLFTKIRTHSSSSVLLAILIQSLHMVPITSDQYSTHEATIVLLNGIICGCVSNSNVSMFVQTFKTYRQTFTIPIDASISYSANEIIISCDSEECYSPLVRLENLHKLPQLFEWYGDYLHLLWHQLLIHGVIEYINKDEEKNLIFAFTFDDIKKNPNVPYTHIQLEVSKGLFGVSGACIPFSDKNQSPRNIYATGMAKQALGTMSLNFYDHLQSKSHILNYGQRPIVTTSMTDCITFDEVIGYNVIAAIMIYTGYNMEDSVLLNQSAVDMGLFRSTVVRSFNENESKHHGDEEQILPYHGKNNKRNREEHDNHEEHLKKQVKLEGKSMEEPRKRKKKKPETLQETWSINMLQEPKRRRLACFDKLESNGIVAPGMHMNQHDVLVNKGFRNSLNQMEDASVTSKPNETMVIKDVRLTTTKENTTSIRFVAVSNRIPEIGDKFASRHGQKGVCGLTVRSEDLPFTADGIVPEIVVNPHAIPSRMTIGHLVETYVGKNACLKGTLANGTPFRNNNLSELSYEEVQKFAKTPMRDGRTGELLKCGVFLGVIFYQRLKHMVTDKFHARREGPNQIITRQPLEGRGRKGGFRFGGMEKDCLVSHGAANIVKERFVVASDKYTVYTCSKCGTFAETPAPSNLETIKHQQAFCQVCQSHDNIHPVVLPYATKLTVQELMSLHSKMQLILED